MKSYSKGLALLITIIMLCACNPSEEKDGAGTKKVRNDKQLVESDRAPLFTKRNLLPAELRPYFTGEVFLQPLLPRDKNNDYTIGHVTFSEGARTVWHTHPKGQVLIVTQGIGINQEKGKPAQIIKKGDVVNIPANVLHWHGATADHKMSHIAISNYMGRDNVEWKAPVTDKEFSQSNKKQ